MGAILGVLANPVVTKLAGKIIDKLFNRSGGNEIVYDKVKSAAAAGAITSVVLTVIGFFYGQEIVQVMQGAGIEQTVSAVVAAVSGVVVFVQTMIAYFQKESE